MAVPAFERGAEARSESCLLVENDSRLLGDCPIELRSTDQAEIDKGLAEALARFGLRGRDRRRRQRPVQ